VRIGKQGSQVAAHGVELAMQSQKVDLFGFSQELAGRLAWGHIGAIKAGGQEGYPHLVN
jgi:hypothetical protein